LIRTMEERLGFSLLKRKAGGHSGGGSMVTSEAKELMGHYERFRGDVKVAIEKIYRKHFGSSPHPYLSPKGRSKGERKKGDKK